MTEVTAKQILINARALIEDPEHWTKGDFARRANKTPTFFDSTEATCFCALGALYRSSLDAGLSLQDGDSRLYTARAGLNSCLPFTVRKGYVDQYNDANTTTHADILRLFDCAIEKVDNK